MRIIRLFIFLFAFFLIDQHLDAQELLSERAQISVLTFGPGTEVYSIWGHTAIRVNDPINRIDKVYNYGTYDFDTPNFLAKFIRGKLEYTLSVQRYHRVIALYKREKRWIKEQLINLSPEEINTVYSLLEENNKPENRYYKYDFLFDNCATRPVEMIVNNTIDSIHFLDSYKLTYRNILDEHLIHNPWADFGIDLIIGSLADKDAKPMDQMFMPVYIYRYFASASMGKMNESPLVIQEKQLAEEGKLNWAKTPALLTPLAVSLMFFILEIVLLILVFLRKKRLLAWYDNLFFLLMGLGSLLLIFMWFGTDHIPTKYNWNLWWMNPFYLLLLPILKNSPRKKLAKALFVLIILFLISSFFIPQQFHLAVLPLIGIMGIKTYKLAFVHFREQAD